MSAQTALALVPVNPRTDARFKSLGEELVYAWDRTDSRVAKQWAVSTVGTFGVSLKRRASNLFKLVDKLSVGAAAETVAAVVAYRQPQEPGRAYTATLVQSPRVGIIRFDDMSTRIGVAGWPTVRYGGQRRAGCDPERSY